MSDDCIKPALFTCLSPALLHLYDVQDTVVVIIDVFRATSTIAAALYNGAARILPVDSVHRCIELGRETGGITAGERDGKIAEGLQHGNSPLEYPREFIKNQTLVLTTTNGTKLLYMAVAQGADTIVTGSFGNLSAVSRFLVTQNKNVLMACAAWKDRVNLEDMLFAGAVVEQVRPYFTIHCDSSLAAETLYRQQKDNLWEFVTQTTHFHRLSAYGLQDDMKYCIAVDAADVLPVFRNGELVPG